MVDAPLPLSRYKVLDLTRARAGPTTARQLADWGADVIKVEMAEGGEGGGFDGHRDSADFQNLHRNKRSLTIDLKSDDGRRIFNRLAENVDVIVENFRPDVKHRLGIDYESIRALNPRIVYGSISGFGQDGPYAGRPGVDQIAQGMSGLMSVTGLPGQGPVRAGAAVADMSAGLYLSIGILLALIEREQSGQGQWVQTSLVESLIAVMDFQSAAWLFDRKVPVQAGNNHPYFIPTGTFPTKDGHINIGSGTQSSWARLCKALGAEDLQHRPAYADAEKRREHRDELNEELSAILSTRSSAEWVEALNAASVPCGPIYSIDQAFADPQVKHLGIATPIKHPRLGRREIVGQPIHMSRTPWQMRRVTPDAGEHSSEILRELGFSDDEIAGLRDRKII
ncbi:MULTISPECIES: CoA transferase [unclassified Beijerinckia]|uniref:CaiB/BaiF CoA transferase family protein n=1 Tax=unclassified Beijerinckia TaxID=2638183 RepID=UPI00089D52F8|nr:MULTISPECIES: CoA transferase [unclassified Beijerinckia]MDH7797915.1 crotonobetainyl-CoA:carnitine CoA-transferase CaiB-like acyl-CoA transferase [Beijerinckia sp. GAS462]SED02732.1 formyl-CoA transferase [Beijerinckia sp. 28-YEA-48]